ncbi:KR-domain-containing protein [Aspergillus ellipticus CBS 707.79]|uniref:KR-domain-containing protein n=1 Tax=Aspergillus ellipticus CBS 707.79 TaxID=1448320 RepID=A0A319D965_9EURO|nr:KR-domain-containing protein [Aspergillus ellipticus CBS 707.79]
MTQQANPARQNEPIAIVGIGCRLPGHVSSPAQLWDFLIYNQSDHCHVPKERYNAESFYHPDTDKPGGYPGFRQWIFWINNVEARDMDPQQRKLLEVVYEALENAGIPMEQVQGSETGVFAGNFANDHMIMQFKDPESLSRYSATGSNLTILANRITHSFDLRANGYGRAEAVSAVYLKRLSDAIRDQDPIRSVIRGTALNGNGRTIGIMQSSIESQKAVSRAAYRRAGLAMNKTDYIEAHGTGTKVGDPMEVQAISEVFSHEAGRPTLVGGAKPNFGHSEAASGLTGVIKVTLALENQLIPATIGVKSINPEIKTREWNIDIVRNNMPWPRSAIPRAGIYASGFGGSNSHAILEAAAIHCNLPARGDIINGSLCPDSHHGSTSLPESSNCEHTGLNLILLSAKSEASLTQIPRNLAAYTTMASGRISLDDLAFTLGCRRSRPPFRGFFLESQSSLYNGLNLGNIHVPKAGLSGMLPFSFIYTGQGAQWAGMGVDLIQHNAKYKERIQYLDSCLQNLSFGDSPSWKIEESLLTPATKSDINLAERSQPICTAIQISLTDLLCDWGVLPEIVFGHSSGELAAAYAAGFLTAREAILASYFRGIAVSKCPLSIDGMFQTAFVATTGGKMSNLGGKVPVAMDSLYVSPPSVVDMKAEKWSTDAVSENVCFGTVMMNSELYNTSGQVLVRMNNGRCVNFQAKTRTESLEELSPGTIPEKSILVPTLELRDPLLAVMDEYEMTCLKICSERASIILWLSNGNWLGGKRPEFAPALGLSRCLILGQPSLKFAILNIDHISGPSSYKTSENAVRILHQLIHHETSEFEFAQKEGVLHISRWEPDEPLNTMFRLKLNEDIGDEPLKDAGHCALSVKNPGQFPRKISPGDVEIKVSSVGMNAKDLYVITARVDTEYCSCSYECAGFVTEVGENVSGFKRGDRVVAMAPGHFATVERFPQWTVCKLNDDEDLMTASTIPMVFSTVIYGLQHRASLEPGESVLIHSAAGGVGIAAIQYAKHLGARIFATVGTETKKAFLVENFNLEPEHIFSSRDTSFLPAILEATSGRGVDVVLNSLTGELLHSSFKACADFGRFIEIGKRDILDHGTLDMTTFGRNVQAHHRLWNKLLTESMNLIRSGICKPCFPIRTFDASEIVDAFRHFSLGSRIGKVAVSFQNEDSKIRIIPRMYETAFSHQKCYLMVGCLGGLGRSLTNWMVSQGARNLVFLSRSGSDKSDAKSLIDDLQEDGVRVTVIRGDVCVYEDVDRAIHAASLPIEGVIHAAMAINEALWDDMSHEQWHTTIAPKVQGTWNLQNALQKDTRDSELDFFVMTSSISGTVGISTESNYCAANAFLDAFARYRNGLGLPAVSVGYGMISDVGYLHDNPHVKTLLKRKGIHLITEEELLQIMDLAIAHHTPTTWEPRYDNLAGSHLLTGVEFTGLEERRTHGFDGDNYILSDQRASLYAASFRRQMDHDSNPHAIHTAKNNLPAELRKSLQENNSQSVLDSLRLLVSRKISKLILLPEGKLQPDQPLSDFGLDSMLAAEFRTFIFRTFDVEMPFVSLLNRSATVNFLSGLIAEGLRVDRCYLGPG